MLTATSRESHVTIFGKDIYSTVFSTALTDVPLNKPPHAFHNHSLTRFTKLGKSPLYECVFNLSSAFDGQLGWKRPADAIVTRVLTEPARRQAWAAEVAQMAERLRASRVVLHAVLTKIGCPPPHGTRLSTWQHVLDQRGMFTYTGLTTAQVDRLRVRHHIYMPRDGRICMATLNADSCEVLAAAIKTVLDETSETLDGSSDGGAAESTSPRVSDAGDEGQQHTAKKPRV